MQYRRPATLPASRLRSQGNGASIRHQQLKPQYRRFTGLSDVVATLQQLQRWTGWVNELSLPLSNIPLQAPFTPENTTHQYIQLHTTHRDLPKYTTHDQTNSLCPINKKDGRIGTCELNICFCFLFLCDTVRRRKTVSFFN